MKPRQSELAGSHTVFNLACECGVDPDRVLKERLDAAIARAAAREYELKMQRTFSQCPGFIGGDAPSSENGKGHVVVDPGKALEAREWLKRRFHCNDALELSDQGLCIEVVPRARRKAAGGPRRVRVAFGKLEQFTLSL